MLKSPLACESTYLKISIAITNIPVEAQLDLK